MKRLTPEETFRYFRRTYEEEFGELGPDDIEMILQRGRDWNLASVLNDGGVVVFPHVHISDCGPYVAAAVEACLDTGADQILAIGVLHSFASEMSEAKARIADDECGLMNEPLRAIYGNGLTNRLDCWEHDHGLYAFEHLLLESARGRGVSPPKLFKRYPFLTGTRPETLPGITDLQLLARDSVLVSTADHCHHGIGYGNTRQGVIYPDEEGLGRVRAIIEDGLALLAMGNYKKYLEHCVQVAKSDWRDAGPLVNYLRGPIKPRVLGIIASDFAKSIYRAPSPTWCAGALVQLTA